MYPYPIVHKKRPSTEDQEASSFGLTRKKFISEESFAKDMAAMTLNSMQQQVHEQQYQANYQQYGIMQYSFPSNNKHVIHINNMDQFLDNDEEDTEVIDASHVIHTENDGRQAIVENGLPLVWTPGDKKPRIPDFVLTQSELNDPRDRLAFEKYLNTGGARNVNRHVEILNNPTIHALPSSMEID
ncbi:hypothetical protein A0J61_00353 [Choanephora cucurbitarum]|uniref:Uncharacterized protein n=1 Tax=Choanephora cucurbitarum TaxID=101091 RepID=A0A1C7NR73_9FUNG|nr:hypothetical protein A0J61_00353 [Choanephora cucurbitarum]